MLKKYATLFLAFIFVFAVMCGCSPKQNPAPTPQTPPPDVSGVTFADRSVVYDGTTQSVTVTDLPDGVDVKYENNAKKDAGTYAAKAELYSGETLLKTLEATLTVQKKAATVTIDDKSTELGDEKAELTYTASGVVAGDDLGVTLSVDIDEVGTAQITGTYTNTNYEVAFTSGTYTVTAPDASGVVFADKTVEYTGTAQTVTATNIPNGYRVEYDNNEHTEPGAYTATARVYKGSIAVTTLTAKLTVTEKIMDNLTGTTDNFVANLAPFALKDAPFSSYVVTSISFVYGGFANGANAGSQNLFMPVYVVKTDLSTRQADCTVENGKKVLLDFTGKLDGVNVGDVLTADDLDIQVGADETLAFGDHEMTVLPKYRKNDSSYGFNADIFSNNVQRFYGNSLNFTVIGYPTADPDLSGVTFADKTDETDGTVGVSITATNIPDGITVRYENNTHNKDGEYTAKAMLYRGQRIVKTLTAHLTVKWTMNNLRDAVLNTVFVPGYTPFVLQNNIFGGKMITSVSFMFAGYGNGANANSSNLYMPIYVIKSDLSTKQSECTVENGKKVILDFTGKLSEIYIGETLTVDNLNIRVEQDETLAFGDSGMTVLPAYVIGKTQYTFKGKAFEGGPNVWDDRSLTFRITGHSIPNDAPNISFLGDSISTYSGYSNNTGYNSTIGNNAVWFPRNDYVGANMTVNETWWYRTASQMGYNVCVNNSWSGSVVNTTQTYDVRAKNLHNNAGDTPDVIVMFMGVNDFVDKASAGLGGFTGAGEPPASIVGFGDAYGKTVQTIKQSYPDAKVFCCTFLPDRKRTTNGVNGSGISETQYNAVIRSIASGMGCYLIDLYNDSGITASNIESYTVDKLHPNSTGMEMIANTVVNAIRAAA